MKRSKREEDKLLILLFSIIFVLCLMIAMSLTEEKCYYKDFKVRIYNVMFVIDKQCSDICDEGCSGYVMAGNNTVHIVLTDEGMTISKVKEICMHELCHLYMFSNDANTNEAFCYAYAGSIPNSGVICDNLILSLKVAGVCR